jgi:hypothetical protein
MLLAFYIPVEGLHELHSLSWHQTDIVKGRKSEVQICSGHDMIKYATQTNEMRTFQINALIRLFEVCIALVYVA